MKYDKDISEIANWEEAVEEGRDPDEWPYPDQFTRSIVDGELAQRVRRIFAAPENESVSIISKTISGGYSEYTQENDYEFTIECGTNSIEFYPRDYDSTLNQLLNWLKKQEAKLND